jgi:hypothetical protein
MTLPALPAPAEAPVAKTLTRLDEQLAGLSLALQSRDAQALQSAADQLTAALEAAAPALRDPGTLTPALRRQLAYAVGRVAAHREALARATASVDRAIQVLLPASVAGSPTYSAHGYAERAAATASAWA